MFYYHHLIWEYVSKFFAIPTLLLVVYRFIYNTPSQKEGGWAKYQLREKYSTWY